MRKSALWSYDSRASGGSLYPHTAGGRGKYGGTIYTVNSHLIINFRDTGKISSEVNALNEIYPAHAAENLNNSAGTIKHRIGNTTYIVERVFSGKLTPRQIVVEEIVSNAKCPLSLTTHPAPWYNFGVKVVLQGRRTYEEPG